MSRAAIVSSEIEVTASPDVAFTVFTEELDLWWVRGPINFNNAGRVVEVLPAYVAEDPEGHRWTFAQARPTQRP